MMIPAARSDLVGGQRQLLPTGRRRQLALHPLQHHGLHRHLRATPAAHC